jgi:hypothetical protein
VLREQLFGPNRAHTDANRIGALTARQPAAKVSPGADLHILSITSSFGHSLHGFGHHDPFDRLAGVAPDRAGAPTSRCAALGDGCFASAGRDLTLRIWDRAYDCVTIYPPMMRSIGCVAACPQGRVIAIGSYGGQVYPVPAR